MIRNRHLAKWLMITLIMAIGIGTFGALYINSEKKKEANDAQPSSYLTNQRQHDIDITFRNHGICLSLRIMKRREHIFRYTTEERVTGSRGVSCTLKTIS